MAMNDPLASALSKITNAEKVGKDNVKIHPVSTQIKRVLAILNEHNYLGAFQEDDTPQGKHITLELLHSINAVGVIKPRFSFKKADYENVEKQYLPAKDFGVIIVSTSEGIMTLDKAKEKGVGGKLIAYCY